MHTLEKVEAQLHTFLEDKITRAADIDDRYVELWHEIERYLKAGGKRMRPRLVLLAYDAYKKSEEINITKVAAAWELLHACLLVHDDIIDRDLTRHGQPNIAGRYQSVYGKLGVTDTSHYAMSAALLSGDLLMMSAYEMAMSADITSSKKLLALDYLNKALFAVAGGELIDTDSVLYPIEKSNPQAIMTHKTASYTLQMPLQCGAAMADASKEELLKLHALGLHAGVAFQLRDDLLGLFGESSITGKSNRSDVFEKKRTTLVHAALEALSSDEAARLAALFAPDHEITSYEAEEIISLIESSGAKEAVEHTIEEQTKEALQLVDTLGINDIHKKHFAEIISKLTTRTS